MRLETAQVFKFFFTYEGTELMIPLAAATPEEAQAKLRNLMLKWSEELGMPPGTVASPVQPVKTPISLPDPMILEARIEDLIKTLIPLKKPEGPNTVDKLVKKWTGFTMSPENYPSIIAELSRMNPNDKGN